jgi:hypothetical protein
MIKHNKIKKHRYDKTQSRDIEACSFCPQGNYVGMTEAELETANPQLLEAKLSEARSILYQVNRVASIGSCFTAKLSEARSILYQVYRIAV